MPTIASANVRRMRIPVDELDLDPLNPRIIVPEGATQVDLLTQLYEEEGLDELVASFVESGYFEEEPLVVVRWGQRYRTVEGNRRLATLKLLLDPRLRTKVGVTGWPKLTASQSGRLKTIPTVVYGKREDVIPFLGYRHITGAKKWGPFQKARFVAQLLDTGESLDHIQELIGDTTQTTKKLYQDFVVYQQITEDLGMSPTAIRERFSLLEVALGQRPIKTHLGLPRRLPTSAVDQLVPDDYFDELREVTRWIFGDSDTGPVITESRDISRRLAKVIENEDALEHLRATNDLDAAYERSGGEQQYLLRRLSAAERAVRDAAGLLPIYGTDPDVVAAVERLDLLVKGLRRQLT
ncbi:MAG: hypothetical protein ACJ77A_02550 [Actinomycetota bacterium]